MSKLREEIAKWICVQSGKGVKGYRIIADWHIAELKKARAIAKIDALADYRDKLCAYSHESGNEELYILEIERTIKLEIQEIIDNTGYKTDRCSINTNNLQKFHQEIIAEGDN